MTQPPSFVGDPINFRGFVYAPLHAWGVFSVFSTIIRELRFQVEEVWPTTPGCIARRQTARGWERVIVVCTMKSRDARAHAHDWLPGTLLLCWEHDWPECPVEIIELRTLIQHLAPHSTLAPVSMLPFHRELAHALAVQSGRTRELFRALDHHIRGLSDTIEARATLGRNNAGGVSYYAPERVFLCVDFRKNGHGLALSVFTRGRPMEGVTPGASSLWGSAAVRAEADLSRAVPLVKASYEAIQLALQHREPTSKSVVRVEPEARVDTPGDCHPA